jgi:AraC family transcriptional regulator
VIDIAAELPFRSQAHFTTVFKRLVGETLYRWRTKVKSERWSNGSGRHADA